MPFPGLTWVKKFVGLNRSMSVAPAVPPGHYRPAAELLEDRSVPAAALASGFVPGDSGFLVEFRKGPAFNSNEDADKAAFNLPLTDPGITGVLRDDGVAVINYADDGGPTPFPTGNFSSDNGFPDRDLGQASPIPGEPKSPGTFTAFNNDNWGTKIDAVVYFPTAGTWTMQAFNDDGFEVDIGGDTTINTNGGCCSTTTATLNVPAPGYYTLQGFHGEGGGGAHLELAAKGAGQPNFALVGNPTDPNNTLQVFQSGSTFSFSASTYTATESNGSAIVTVTRPPAEAGYAVTVHYATHDGSALSPDDFTATSGDLTFAPGVTSMDITIPLVKDSAVETFEDFTVDLSVPNGLPTAGTVVGTANVTIVSSDFLLNGTTGDDTVSVSQTSGGATGDITYILNGGAPVQLSGITSFTFSGSAGYDQMTVIAPPNGALISGPIVLDSNGGDALIADAAHRPVYSLPGQLTIGALGDVQQSIRYTGVNDTNIQNALSVNSLSGSDTADRTGLSPLSPTERFVRTMYLGALGRPGALQELDGWANSGLSTSAMASGIEHSSEARTHLVRTWYQLYLGRTANGTEELGWVNSLQSGASEETILSGILGSDEFYARAQFLQSSGTADQRYIESLYQILLSRDAGSTEVAGWVNPLPMLGRQSAAAGFLNSDEWRLNTIGAQYTTLLRRSSTTTEAAGWLTFWTTQSADATALRVQFEASQEYFIHG